MKNLIFGKNKSVVTFAEAYASAKKVKADSNVRQVAVRARRAAKNHAAALPKFIAVYTAAAAAWAEKAARDVKLTAELKTFVNGGCKAIVMADRREILVQDLDETAEDADEKAEFKPNLQRFAAKETEIFKFDLQLFAEKKPLITSATEEDLLKLDGIGKKNAHSIFLAIRNSNTLESDMMKACLTAKAFKSLKAAYRFTEMHEDEEISDVRRMHEAFVKYQKHIGNNAVIRELTEKDGLGYVQKLTFVRGKDKTTAAKLDVTAIEINPVNRGYFEENVELQQFSGVKKTFRRGSKDIVIFDISAISSASKDDKTRMAAKMDGAFYIAKVDNEATIVVENEGIDFVDYIDLRTGKLVDEKVVEGAPKFFGDLGLGAFSAGQGRNYNIMAFRANGAEDAQRFVDALDEATLGEYSLNVETLRKVTSTERADINTRMGSKLTGLGLNKAMGCGLKAYVILLNKNDNTDGRFAFSARAIAQAIVDKKNVLSDEAFDELVEKLTGYVIQARPYTVKGAGLSCSQAKIDLDLRDKKVYVLDVDDPKNAQKLDQLNAVLSKPRRSRAKINLKAVPGLGYDAIKVCHGDVDAPVDFYADLNAFKDQFDLRRVDGVNVVAVPRGKKDFIVTTSAQFLKVALMGVKKSGLSKALKAVMEKVIERTLNETFDIKASKKSFGAEMLDCSYLSGLIKDLNPSIEALQFFPNVLRDIMENMARSAENIINLDKYNVDGTIAMMTSDPTIEAFGEGVLKVTKEYIEVFDPAFLRYAAMNGIDVKNYRGVAIKHPSMGTREILFVVFITEEEMCDRIAALGKKLGRSEDDIEICQDTIRSFKEGGVIIPEDLPSVAQIAAGSDLDGDEIIIHYPTKDNANFAALLWAAKKSGKFSWVAVDIVPDNKGSKKRVMVDGKIFISQMHKNLLSENASVGAITNAHDTLNQFLLAEGKDIEFTAKAIYSRVFGMGKEASSADAAYVSPLKRTVNKYGIEVIHTSKQVVTDVLAAMRKAAPTKENILAAAEDWDVIGRHQQELTIDAQKKDYEVHDTEYIQELSDAVSTLRLKNRITFVMGVRDEEDMEEPVTIETDLKSGKASNSGYLIDDNGVVTASSYHIKREDKDALLVIKDSFADFRVLAATKAVKKLNELKDEYRDFVELNDEGKKCLQWYNASYDRFAKNKDGLLDRVIDLRNMMYASGNIYRDLKKQAEGRENDSKFNYNFTREDKEKIAKEGRKFVYDEMNAIYAAISNEARKIVADFKGDASVMRIMAFLSRGKAFKDSSVGKLFKEEFAQMICRKSETSEVHYELYGMGSLVASEATGKIIVKNGEAWTQDGLFVDDVDLVDGEYRVEEPSDGKVELVRPLCELINIPEADDSKLIVLADDEAKVNIGDVVTFKTDRGINPKAKATVEIVVNEKTVAEIKLSQKNNLCNRLAGTTAVVKSAYKSEYTSRNGVINRSTLITFEV